MDKEFDTSIDTSLFDDVTPDTSDIGSFDDASDIVSVMDEAMDTSSFEMSADLDASFADTSEDVASIMDGIEELNIEDVPVETDDLPLETESEIENLMDDTEGISSEIVEPELSDITDAGFAEELPEQSEIADILDEAATDIEPETSEFTDSDFAEVSEQDSREIESLMDEAALDNTSEDAEIMNEGEIYDIPHDEISDIQADASETESSKIEDIMNETEPISDDIEESTMDEGETCNIPYDEEIFESLSETDNGSEISNLMDIEEIPDITEEESLEAGADLANEEVLVEDVSDNVPENEKIEETDYIEQIEQVTDSNNIPERIYDNYEEEIMQQRPDFYESGSFYEQGFNMYGYEGTCGPTSQANALNKLLHTNEFTENKVLGVAISNELCTTVGSPDLQGGTTTDQFMKLYEKLNEQLGGRITTELYKNNDALDVNEVAKKLDEGSVINVAVDSYVLWDQQRDYVNSMGILQDDFYSDHWITVTGARRDDMGNIRGFDIIDSGGGINYVSADKYHEMCFGTDEHRVIDPTTIVVSKNGVTSDTIDYIEPDNQEKSQAGGNWFQRLFERRNK